MRAGRACEGWVATTQRGFSYLWGPRRSGNRDPAFGCHPHRPGNCLGSLHNCRRSAQPLRSLGEDRMSQAHQLPSPPRFRIQLESVKRTMTRPFSGHMEGLCRCQKCHISCPGIITWVICFVIVYEAVSLYCMKLSCMFYISQ